MNRASPAARRFRALALAACVLATGAGEAVTPLAAVAGAGGESPERPLTPAQAEQMVARLSDGEVRALLLEHLQRSAAAGHQAAPQPAPWLLTGRVVAIDRVHAVLGRLHEADDEAARLADLAAGEGGWLLLLACLGASLAGGLLVERFATRRSGLIARLRELPVPPDGAALGIGRVLLDGVVALLSVLLFLVGAALVLAFTPGLSEGGRALASGLIWLVAGIRAVAVFTRAVLVPHRAPAPWPLAPAVARCISRQVSVVAAFTLGNLIVQDLLADLGAAEFLDVPVRFTAGLLLIVSVTWSILAVRRAMGPVRTAGDARAQGLLDLVRDQWHRLAVLAAVVIFALAVYRRLVTGEPALLPALGSLALILAVPLLDYLLRALAARLVRPAPDRSDAEPLPEPASQQRPDAEPAPEPASLQAAEPAAVAQSPEAQADAPDAPDGAATDSYRRALVVNLRLLLAIGIIQSLASLWGFQLAGLVEGLLGARFAGALFQIGITCVFAFIVWQVVKAAVAAHAPPDAADAGEGGDGGGTGLTRMQTLMPIFAKTVGGVLLVMVAMISLSALGVDIGPLLAGAGVVGLAVGFGAQTLVRDVVSGIFFLMDDAFRMGEYVTVDNIRGTVEKISVRSLRLRHHRGPVHTLPYGEISHITNYSRDYAIMAFELRVPFETDVERVRKLIKKVGAELMENEELAPTILEPLKSQGVNRMDDSAFVIRCKFTTLPGKQFTVRRHAFARIQEAFEAEGIQFAPRRVIVETRGPGAPDEAALAAAAEAAAAAEPAQRS